MAVRATAQRVPRRVGAALFVVCGVLSLLSFASGVAVFGKDDVSYGCAVEAPRPTVGGPYFENTQVRKAERTLLPLGAVCLLDSPDDRVGAQTVRVQNWAQTVVWLTSGAVAFLGLLLVVRPVRVARSLGRLRR
jgi:hypothetical protein